MKLAGAIATVFAMAVAALLVVILPLNYDQDHGRWGSIVWSIEAALDGYGIGKLAIGMAMGAGVLIWLAVFYRCFKERNIFPEVVLFGIFMSSTLIQTVSWERYVEFQIVATLAIVFVRFELTRSELLILVGWYGVYLSAGIVRLMESPVKNFAG
jgi:hypothetical protein